MRTAQNPLVGVGADRDILLAEVASLRAQLSQCNILHWQNQRQLSQKDCRIKAMRNIISILGSGTVAIHKELLGEHFDYIDQSLGQSLTEHVQSLLSNGLMSADVFKVRLKSLLGHRSQHVA